MNLRLLSTRVILYLFFLPLSIKLFYLQLWRDEFLYQKAKEQQEKFLVMKGERGKILDRRGRILAMDKNFYSIFANPKQIRDKEETAKVLSELLKLNYESILRKLKEDRFFVWIRRGIESKELIHRIRDLGIEGIGVKVERRRIYPQGELAAHVLGAVDIDNNGIAGLELYYQDILKGRPGYILTIGDAREIPLSEFSKVYSPPRNGHTLVLTIDLTLQHYVERVADELYRKYNAKRVSIVMMDPYTGEILALANRPTYDPNSIGYEDLKHMRNFAITDLFEPGSVFKVIAATALLEEGLVDPKEKIYCGRGAYKIGRRILHDYRPYGWLNFRQVIIKSSNIGVAKFVSRLDKVSFYNYLKLFGIGEKTGIDLPGEARGILREPERWTNYSMASIAIGHEVAVTTLQLAKMMSIIANGGYDTRPHIVKEIRDENGIMIREVKIEGKRRLLSPTTVEEMKSILRDVVESGTAKLARSEFYSAGGKTGTAQKADIKNGGYFKDRFVASFVGFLPVEAPKIVIALTVDEPKPVHFGGLVCAPAFKEIAERSLVYLELSGERRRAKNETERNFVWD